MTTEFKPTHRYLGGDDAVYSFKAGDEVMYVEEWKKVNGRTNSDFVNADGTVQTVYDDCMEAL